MMKGGHTVSSGPSSFLAWGALLLLAQSRKNKNITMMIIQEHPHHNRAQCITPHAVKRTPLPLARVLVFLWIPSSDPPRYLFYLPLVPLLGPSTSYFYPPRSLYLLLLPFLGPSTSRFCPSSVPLLPSSQRQRSTAYTMRILWPRHCHDMATSLSLSLSLSLPLSPLWQQQQQQQQQQQHRHHHPYPFRLELVRRCRFNILGLSCVR